MIAIEQPPIVWPVALPGRGPLTDSLDSCEQTLPLWSGGVCDWILATNRISETLGAECPVTVVQGESGLSSRSLESIIEAIAEAEIVNISAETMALLDSVARDPDELIDLDQWAAQLAADVQGAND